MKVVVIILIVSCVLGTHTLYIDNTNGNIYPNQSLKGVDGHNNHTETDPQPQPSKDDYCLFGVKDGLPTGECRFSPGEDAGIIAGICALIVVGIGIGIIYCCCCKGRRRGNSVTICCNCVNSQGQHTQSSGNEAPRKEKDPPPSYDECNA